MNLVVSLIFFSALVFHSGSTYHLGARKTTDPRCGDPGMVFIEGANGFKRGCMKKVLPNFPCEYNEQCNSDRDTVNSFCGWSLASDKQEVRVCQCHDGFTVTADGHGCVPYRDCGMDGFNSALERGSCRIYEFCRKRICLCLPDFGFDLNGECIHLREFEDDKPLAIENQDIGLIKQTLEQQKQLQDYKFNMLEDQQRRNTIWLCSISTLIVVGAVVALLVNYWSEIVALFQRKKKNSGNAAEMSNLTGQQGSSAPKP